MTKEKGRSLFKNYLAASEAVLDTDRRAHQQASEHEETLKAALIEKFDEFVGPELQKAEDLFLKRDEVSSVQGIFEEFLEEAAKKEKHERNKIHSSIEFHMSEPFGKVALGKQFSSDEKIKIVQFLNQSDSNLSLGIINNSINGMVFRANCSYDYGVYIDEVIALYREGHFWKLSYEGDTKALDLDSFAKSLAMKVTGRTYLHSPAPMSWIDYGV